MADIHILVPATLDLVRGQRLFRDLKAAFEAGEDLGSRIPYIKASARALAELGTALLAQASPDSGRIGEFGIEDPAVADALRRLSLACQALHRTVSKLVEPAEEAGIAAGKTCRSDVGSVRTDRAQCGARSDAPTKASGGADQPPVQALRPGA